MHKGIETDNLTTIHISKNSYDPTAEMHKGIETFSCFSPSDTVWLDDPTAEMHKGIETLIKFFLLVMCI